MDLFGQPWMLLGLAALAIPVIIHLLNRRRFDQVDWGAMQFLQVSKVTRRRLFLEEILLMLLRMGLIALLVVALAAFHTDSDVLARLETRPNRDVVLVFDGSSSMNYSDGAKTADQLARDWALAYVHDLQPGDAVAVLQAKQQVVPVVGTLDSDLQHDVAEAIRGHDVSETIRGMPRPAGGCDWPAALQAAHAILAKSERAEKDVIILSDNQRVGWADSSTLERWDLLGRRLKAEQSPTVAPPRVWVVNVDPDRAKDPPNWALAPLRVIRPVVPVNREVVFRTDLEIHGPTAYTPPEKISLEVDGKLVRTLEPPLKTALEKGRIPFTFSLRFPAEGVHLVTLVVQPDPPGVSVKDHTPDDNRQDFAVEVTPPLPVLIVDGDPDADPAKTRGAFSMRNALSPENDPTPAVKARVISVSEFGPATLTEVDAADRPRVLILANVARLTREQAQTVEQFLADGGGVLATLGNRVEAGAYNKDLYQEGQGWLPARLEKVEGDESKAKDAARPAAVSATHPALELFRDEPLGGLADARFPRWWQTDATDKDAVGVRVAVLKSPTAEYSFLVERPFKAGRVLLCSVPLDKTWGANLPGLPAFVPLVHELVYYLAGARSAEFNPQPGQPLRRRLTSEAQAQGFRLLPPVGDEKPVVVGPPMKGAYPAQLTRQANGVQLLYEDTRETGVYRLSPAEGPPVYYVVQPDPRESDLTPCTVEDRDKVAAIVPMKYEDRREPILGATLRANQRQEWWWWVFLLGLVGLLCGEVWMTRRMLQAK